MGLVKARLGVEWSFYPEYGVVIMDWSPIVNWVYYWYCQFRKSSGQQLGILPVSFCGARWISSLYPWVEGTNDDLLCVMWYDSCFVICGMLVVYVILAWKTSGGAWGSWISDHGGVHGIPGKDHGGAHDVPNKDYAGEPMAITFMLHDILWLYVIGYFEELTKLCAYGFRFMFQVLQFSNERARDDCKAHTTCFCILWITLIWWCFC